MEAALVIKAVIALFAFGAWAYGKIKGAEAPAPIAATPPPLTRRARRVRGAAAPAPVAPEPTTPVPVAAPSLDAGSLQVSRPPRARARAQFLGRSALRQAIVAREVLGPPLSLRPPRF